jgi:hypothetical protein
MIQLASDRGNAAALVFFLYLDGEDLRPRPLIASKERLRPLLANAAPYLHYSDHVVGKGPAFYEKACAMHVEGHRLQTHRCALRDTVRRQDVEIEHDDDSTSPTNRTTPVPETGRPKF